MAFSVEIDFEDGYWAKVIVKAKHHSPNPRGHSDSEYYGYLEVDVLKVGVYTEDGVLSPDTDERKDYEALLIADEYWSNVLFNTVRNLLN